MTIKEVSEVTGLSLDTLRYYESAGMIPKMTRTPQETFECKNEMQSKQ